MPLKWSRAARDTQDRSTVVGISRSLHRRSGVRITTGKREPSALPCWSSTLRLAELVVIDERLNHLAADRFFRRRDVAVDDAPGLGVEINDDELALLAGTWDAS